MEQVDIAGVTLSRLCIGGNPFSGFSHQSPERSEEMVVYFTPGRIMDTLHAAESAGINTLFGRTDNHIMGVLETYWDDGGKIQWFAQVSPEPGDTWEGWTDVALNMGAAGAYIHGGIVDKWHAEGAYGNFERAVRIIRAAGAPAGFAGHQPAAHEWIRDNVDCDFQMCCWYNPTDRTKNAEHNAEGEVWDDSARDAMLRVIATIPRPVVHYKIFAAGNKPIVPAFELLGESMRDDDVAVIGIFPKDDPEMLAKDIELFEEYVTAQR